MSDQSWDPDRPPPPVMPVPAEILPSIVGLRVVIGRPNKGFRYDVRAMSEVLSGDDGSQYVEVLAEHDYFRQIVTGVRAPRVIWPAHQTWVEQRGGQREPADRLVRTLEDELADLVAASSAASGMHRDEDTRTASAYDRVVSLEAPPIVRAERADRVARVTGRRAAVSSVEGFHYGYRVVSEPFMYEEGDVMVSLLDEESWYRWILQEGQAMTFTGVPAYHVWVE
jgi:hypothetical protein